jgi:hypothetical protein
MASVPSRRCSMKVALSVRFARRRGNPLLEGADLCDAPAARYCENQTTVIDESLVLRPRRARWETYQALCSNRHWAGSKSGAAPLGFLP